MRKLIMVPLVALAIMSVSVQSVLACVTGTPGYWKNHPEAWPDYADIVIGASIYDSTDHASYLMGILQAKIGRGSGLTADEQAMTKLKQKIISAQLSWNVYDTGTEFWRWEEPNNFGDYPGGLVGIVEDANDSLVSGDRSDWIYFASLIDYWLNAWDRSAYWGM